MPATTSVNVKTSFFPKTIESHVLVGVALIGFKKSWNVEGIKQRSSTLFDKLVSGGVETLKN